ncbi:Cyclin-J18-like [Platanthera zijinensis]|uniref:Cyclin-J18-like n=1 Tax=Platanthera zijinensis TaxID=2320716 RepID=A0AAP0G0T7_9ASPA
MEMESSDSPALLLRRRLLEFLIVSSQLHDTRPLSVKSLKSLGDVLIDDQCFTTRDFADGVSMPTLNLDLCYYSCRLAV